MTKSLPIVTVMLLSAPSSPQVQEYEHQQQTVLKSSFHPLVRSAATSSGSRLGSQAPPTAPARLGLSSTGQSRTSTPTPAGARLHVSIDCKPFEIDKVIIYSCNNSNSVGHA